MRVHGPFDDDPMPDTDDLHAECRDHIAHLEAAAERMRCALIRAETELVRLREEIELLKRPDRRRLGISI
jgi:hypothetical protein